MLERKTIAGRQMILVEGKWVSANKYTQYRGASRRRKAYVDEVESEERERKAEALRETSRDWVVTACLSVLALAIFLFDCTLKGPVLGTDPWGVMKWRMRCKW